MAILKSEFRIAIFLNKFSKVAHDIAKQIRRSVRTYQNYETDESKSSTMKYAFMMQKLEQYGFIDFHIDFGYALF